MIRPAALALILSAGAAAAEVARVKGGEHPDFTRIVVEARGAGDWRFGRTDDGYELALGPEVTGYDLTQAFEKIPRDRVSGLWRDTETGRLRLALSCACHAIAFEFRPGVIVVDIKSGPPPAETAFEAPIDQPAPTPEPAEWPTATEAESERAADAPASSESAATGPASAPDAGTPATGSPGYDWLAIRAVTGTVPGLAPDLDANGLPTQAPAEAALAPLREALLQQISRGVAQGVVEIAQPAELPEPGATTRVEEDGMRIALGDLPGVKARTARDPGQILSASGLACPADKTLAIATWGLDGTPAQQLGPGRSGLLAEFDVPIKAAVLRAARTYIALGFGAEARQFLDLLPASEDADRARLRALTHLVDLEPAEPNPFQGLESCDSAAALWAALALATAPATRESDLAALNTDAMARAFSALPAHLRRHLGPPLVKMFLAGGDEPTARLLRDAILRAPGDAGHDVTLMDADFQLATGQEEKAGDLADGVIEDNSRGRERAAVTRVEAAFQGDRSIPMDLPAALAAYRQDARGTPEEAPLARALVLATAMAGDFQTAFATLPDAPGTAGDLWLLAAEGAGDGLFLEQAIAAAAEPPTVAPPVAAAVADRLEGLGFAEEALAWLGPIRPDSPEADRLLAARARLRLRDAEGAILALAGLSDPEAESLRAAATLQLGDLAEAARALDRAGNPASSDRVEIWTEDWPRIATEGPDPWKTAAGLVSPRPASDANPEPAGLIARGTALVEESAAARATIEALLGATAAPEAAP